jgi:segregation and condensation protein A
MTQDKPSSAPAPSPLPADPSSPPAYRIMLPEFEGPLDLLLHLCQTHEIDILNISVSFVAQKYIEYLELMENMAVEVAADYLVMAAHLAYLKSRELVPAPEPLEASEDGEEPLDPREELIRRLLEYQKYKHAAENLGSRPIEGRNVFVRGAVLQAEGEAGLAEHSVWKLIEHWASTLKKAKPEYTHNVVVDRMSISDRINQIVDLLEAGKGMLRFEDLLGQDVPAAELRHKVVVSLLAVLELAKLHVVRILQQEATGAFFLAQVEGAALDDARRLMVTSGKEDPKKEAEAKTAVEPPADSQSPTPQPQDTSTGPAVAAAPARSAEGDVDGDSEDAEAAGPMDAEFAELDRELAEIDAELARVDGKAASAAEDPEGSDEGSDKEPAAPAEELARVDEEPAGLNAAAAAAAEDPAPLADEPAPLDEEPAAFAEEPAPLADEPAHIDAATAPVDAVLDLESSQPSGDVDAQAPEDLPAEGAREALELRPQDEVISAPSPASAVTGEEATDVQTQEEQTPREE